MRRYLALLSTVVFSACGSSSSDDCPTGRIKHGDECLMLCNDDGDCTSENHCDDGLCISGYRPTVASSPTDGALDVSADTPIMLSFNVPMDVAATSPALSVYSDVGPIAGVLSWNDAHLVMTYTPAEPLPAGKTVYVQLATNAKSEAGIPLGQAFAAQFIVHTSTAWVVSMTPSSGSADVGVRSMVSVTFSEPMSLGETLAAVSLQDGGGQKVVGSVSADVTGTTLTFTPGSALAFASDYALHVGTTASGAVLAAEYIGAFHTTAVQDQIDPTVTLSSPAAIVGTNDLSSNAYTFSGTAADVGSSVDQVTVQVVSGTQAPSDADWGLAALDGTGAWTFPWYPKSLTLVPNGPFTVYARAYDKAGNMAGASASFSADFVAPTLSFTATPPSSVKFRNLTVSITTEANTTVTAYVDGAQAASKDTGASSTATLTVALVSTGTHTLSLVATDSEGNLSTPLVASINKTEYTCLSSTFFGGLGVPYTISDDGNGHVSVTYTLDSLAGDDTHIYRNTDASNYGSSASVEAYSSYFGLFRYADRLVPSCADLTNARWRFYATSNTSSGSIALSVYPLLQPWVETQASGSSYASGSPWGGVGASSNISDRGTQLTSVVYSPASSTVVPVEVDVSSLATSWNEQYKQFGTKNNGVLISSSSGYTTYIASTEAASNRPQITFTLVEPP